MLEYVQEFSVLGHRPSVALHLTAPRMLGQPAVQGRIQAGVRGCRVTEVPARNHAYALESSSCAGAEQHALHTSLNFCSASSLLSGFLSGCHFLHTRH